MPVIEARWHKEFQARFILTRIAISSEGEIIGNFTLFSSLVIA